MDYFILAFSISASKRSRSFAAEYVIADFAVIVKLRSSQVDFEVCVLFEYCVYKYWTDVIWNFCSTGIVSKELSSFSLLCV